MVILYTSPGCASCRKAKQWLKDNQIEFIEKNIFTYISYILLFSLNSRLCWPKNTLFSERSKSCGRWSKLFFECLYHQWLYLLQIERYCVRYEGFIRSVFCKLERANSQYSNLFKCEGYRNIRTYQGLLFRWTSRCPSQCLWCLYWSKKGFFWSV